jgi:hypothetical protein
VLLQHHLKLLRLPTFLRGYDKVAGQSAQEQVDYPRYLLRLSELELVDHVLPLQCSTFFPSIALVVYYAASEGKSGFWRKGNNTKIRSTGFGRSRCGASV